MFDSDQRDDYAHHLIKTFSAFAVAVAAAWLLWRSSQILLILFAGILGGVFIDALARFAQRLLHLPRMAAVTLAIIALLLIMAGFMILVGPQLVDQLEQLASLLPGSLEHLREWIKAHHLGNLLNETKPGSLIPSASNLLGPITGVFSTTFGALATVSIIVILVFYLAISPRPYINGLLRLLPPRRRERGREVLTALGRALRWWLLGRAASMFAVGLFTAIALSILAVPAALALGVFAGLMAFVPFIGPVIGVVPAILITLPGLPWQPLWVIGIYAGVQFVEGNIITPLVQQRTVSLPPVMLLTSQLIAGLLFGLLGLLFATPLAVAVIVLVQMLYIQDILGDHITVLGEHKKNPE